MEAFFSCSVNWEERSYNSMTYIAFLFAMGLAVPLVVMLFSYLNIFYKVRQVNGNKNYDHKKLKLIKLAFIKDALFESSSGSQLILSVP